MDRTAPATHAGHDELLIARLFGGDVSEAERAHALDLMAECRECASLFADLGAIAEATAAIPVPTRPRDFSLTEADAARLGAKARRRWAVFRLGLRRSLGGSLAALGIFGIVLTGVTSVLGGAASTTGGGYALSPERAAGPQAGQVVVVSGSGSSSNFGAASIGTTAPVPMASAASATTAAPATAALNSVPKQSPEPSSAIPVTDTATSPAPVASSSAGSHDLAAASPAATQGAGGAGPGGTKSAEATGAVSSGMDARLAWLIGFGVLVVIGLGLAILPVRRRGRGRGARS